MKKRPISVLLLLLLSIIGTGLVSTLAVSDSEDEEWNNRMMKFELIHRHDPRLVGKQKISQLERIKELLHSDSIRQEMISQKRRLSISTRRKAWETPTSSSIEMPLESGASHRTGQYFVGIKVGTPAQKFTLIADTGSELTWIKCQTQCVGSCATKRRLNHTRVFHASNSSTFKTLPCSSDMCKVDLMNSFSLRRCPTPSSPSAYDFRYVDGSAALGFFANETVTVKLSNGRKTKVENVLIGCSESFKGQNFQAADGVMGLGYSKHSFALKATQNYGGKFSYCLVDHLSPKNVSNYLTFGTPAVSPNNMQFTKLLLGFIHPLYAVNIKGISIGGVMLNNIPPSVWNINGSGGTIVDSGTSLTVLTLPAYQPLMAAVTPSLRKFEKLDLEIGPLEYCFNSTGFDESLVPKLRFHFADGAELEPPVKSYIIDTADGVKCVGFVSANWPGLSVIGNIMQQNHLWEFDLAENKLGFAPSTCT